MVSEGFWLGFFVVPEVLSLGCTDWWLCIGVTAAWVCVLGGNWWFEWFGSVLEGFCRKLWILMFLEV